MYLTSLYKNLYAIISISTEQLYLGIEGWFHLSKVSKLRCEMLGEKKIKNKSSQVSTLLKNVNNSVRTQPIFTKTHMQVF